MICSCRTPLKCALHALFGVTDSHGGGQGVAMIAAAKGEDLRAAANALVQEELDRHLHRDRRQPPNRTRRKRRDRVRPGSSDAKRAARRAAGSWDEPTEHHVRHGGELAANSVGDVRMVVSVAGRPPAGDAVDQHRGPSASVMHAPFVATTGSAGVAVFIWQ